MTTKITKEQQTMWDKLKYDPKPFDGYFYGNPTQMPVNPQAGAMFIDKSSNKMFMYDGIQWVDVVSA